MLRGATEYAGDFAAPPGQLYSRHRGIRDIIDDVVDLAAERVQGRDGVSPRRRQEAKTGGKARPALRNLLLAVGLWVHVSVAASRPTSPPNRVAPAPGGAGTRRRERRLCDAECEALRRRPVSIRASTGAAACVPGGAPTRAGGGCAPLRRRRVGASA